MKEYAEIIGMCLMAVHEKGEPGLITVCNCHVPSQVMLLEYRKLKTKLEDLPQQERQQLWQFAYDNFPLKTKEQRIDVCKIVHTIGNLL